MQTIQIYSILERVLPLATFSLPPSNSFLSSESFLFLLLGLVVSLRVSTAREETDLLSEQMVLGCLLMDESSFLRFWSTSSSLYWLAYLTRLMLQLRLVHLKQIQKKMAMKTPKTRTRKMTSLAMTQEETGPQLKVTGPMEKQRLPRTMRMYSTRKRRRVITLRLRQNSSLKGRRVKTVKMWRNQITRMRYWNMESQKKTSTRRKFLKELRKKKFLLYQGVKWIFQCNCLKSMKSSLCRYCFQLSSDCPYLGFIMNSFRQMIEMKVIMLKQTRVPPTPLISSAQGTVPAVSISPNWMLLKSRLKRNMFETLMKVQKTNSWQTILPKIDLSFGAHFFIRYPVNAKTKRIRTGSSRHMSRQVFLSKVSSSRMSLGGIIISPMQSQRQVLVCMLLWNMQRRQTWMNSIRSFPISVKKLKKQAPIRMRIPRADGKSISTGPFQASSEQLLICSFPLPTARGLLNIRSYICRSAPSWIPSVLACRRKLVAAVQLVRKWQGMF